MELIILITQNSEILKLYNVEKEIHKIMARFEPENNIEMVLDGVTFYQKTRCQF